MNNNLEYKINSILTDWNPINVPEFIAEEEYISYIDKIISIGNDSYLLKKYLIEIVTENMGLAFEEQNESHRNSLNNVINKIIDLYYQ